MRAWVGVACAVLLLGVARAQDAELADVEAAWMRAAVPENAVKKAAFLVRVAIKDQAGPALFVDLPGGGRVVSVTAGRDVQLARIPEDRAARVGFGLSRVLHVAVFDPNDRKLFEGCVGRPSGRVYLSLRPGWDDAKCLKALELQGLAARAAAGNAEAREELRGRQRAGLEDRIAAALAREVLGDAPEAAPVPAADERRVCTRAELDQFLAAIKKNAFDKDRVALVESFVSGHWLTVEQVVEIVKAHTFNDAKVKVVELANPRIVDRGNFYRLYDAFPFDSDKQKVKAIEKTDVPGTKGAGAATTEEEMTDVLARLKKAAFDDGKLSLLESFAQGHQFTVEQGIRLVKSFTFSAGQIKAIGVLYPRLSDRGNFYKLYDVLTFETDKQKLRDLEKEWRGS